MNHQLVKLFLNPRLINTSSRNYIFLMSHMRSRSSLLSHILGSNAEINGNSELQISYENLQKGLIKNNIELSKIKAKYNYDKILHNGLTKNNNFFQLSNAKYIFMIREPNSSIKSIINMWKSLKEKDVGLEQAVAYYKERLIYLNKALNIIDTPFLYLDSNELVTNTQESLTKLENFIGLKEPLNENYKIFENTGKPKSGDMSKNILSGKIIHTNTSENIENLIPEDLLLPVNMLWKEITENFRNRSCC